MKLERKPLLIYHGGCPDGFGAMFAFWSKFGNDMEYCPRNHSTDRFFGLDEEYLVGRDIYMADIAFTREDLIYLNENTKSLSVIDHHKSAEKESGDLSFCEFDMEHSGAVLAWKFCHPDEDVPMLLRYIEDRDLWKFELPYAQEILAAIDSYGKTIEIWQNLQERIEDPGSVADLLREGKAILRYNKILIDRIMRSSYISKILGYKVPMINTPFFRSEIVNKLAEENLFSAGYHFDGNRFIFSLRSYEKNPEAVDVSEIASNFPGGGGHKHAAGFSVKSLSELNPE